MIAILLSLALQGSAQEQQVSSADVLRIGHLVELRGAMDDNGRFQVETVSLQDKSEDDVLLGPVPSEEFGLQSFQLFGQSIETAEETRWDGLTPGDQAGKRIKVEGSWKGPRKFRAKTIRLRGEGRDRIGARIDELKRVEGGLEGRMMIFTFFIPDGVEVEHDRPVQDYELLPARKVSSSSEGDYAERDEDRVFGKGIPLSDTLRMQGQLEFSIRDKTDYDLNSDREEDRTDYAGTARVRVTWSPSEKLFGLAEVRYTERYRRDDDNGVNDSENSHRGGFGETWLQWRDVRGHEGFDVTVGRQDFDEPREWIFDQNLDAVRLTWYRPSWRFDVSTATLLSGGGERDEASNNAVAYLSNNRQSQHLAVWTVFRDFDEFNGDTGLVPDETSWHFGTRAIGEFLPQNASWAEFSYQVGDRPLFDVNGTATGQEADVSAWAYDVGTTWSPSFAGPLYFTMGYALGKGDGDDGTYRQTGWQDNTDRFGGVTSFRYYGELFDPELSNLGILTLGVGARIAPRTSLDFVLHSYTQDVASAEFSPRPARKANIRQSPNGADADLGWEADLIFGYREFKSWDVEIVGATFLPGDGFDIQDNAYFLKFQLRYRF